MTAWLRGSWDLSKERLSISHRFTSHHRDTVQVCLHQANRVTPTSSVPVTGARWGQQKSWRILKMGGITQSMAVPSLSHLRSNARTSPCPHSLWCSRCTIAPLTSFSFHYFYLHWSILLIFLWPQKDKCRSGWIMLSVVYMSSGDCVLGSFLLQHQQLHTHVTRTNQTKTTK